ncbi:MAG: DUF7453 family protein [Limisphaerales bacterium]
MKVILGLLTTVVVTFNVTAASLTFTKVADTGTTIPGGTGNFTAFGNATAVHDGHVVFQARGDNSQSGIYHWANSTLSKVADKNDSVPNGTGTFSFLSFFAFSVLDGRVLFQGAGTGGENGLYAWNGGTLTKLVDHTDAIPAGFGNYTSFRLPFQAGDSVAFIGYGPNSHVGAYVLSNSVITTIADSTTSFPGGTGTFGFSSEVPIEGDTVAFWAFESSDSSRNGIFVQHNGTLTKIAQTGDTAFGTGQTFSNLQSPPVPTGGKIVFQGRLADSTLATFRSNLDGTGMEKLLDVNVAIPSGIGNFSSFGGFVAEGSKLVFVGNGSGSPGTGIYEQENGTSTKVIDLTDMLDGQSFLASSQSLKITSRSLQAGDLAFIAAFDGGAAGIYTTAIGGGGQMASPTFSASSATFSPTSGFSVQFTGEVGQAYQIQYTGALGNAWQTLIDFTYSAPMTVTDATAASEAARLYRVVTQ